MSAPAGLLREGGHTVTGSDENVYPPASTLLAELGIPVSPGYDPARLDGVELVVCGNAVTRTNAEAEAARVRGLRMTSMPAALEEMFLAGRSPLVIAGTHGKTTSTAMLAWVLARAGRDPGFLIGGVPRDLGRRFGLEGRDGWRVTELEDDGATRFTIREGGRAVCRVTLQLPGAINARNALGVLLLAVEAGVGWEEAAAALAEFRGVRRRQEVVGTVGGVTVIDDFAHHPTAVAGTLAALRQRYPGRRLRAVFEPRSNTSRRRVFQDEFVAALAAADEAVLAAVFAKASDPIPPAERLAPETIVADLERRGVPARLIDGVPAIRDYLVATTRAGDVIAIMSNGAFGGLPALVVAGVGAA